MICYFLKCFTVMKISLKRKIHYKLFLLAMSEREIQNLLKAKCIHTLKLVSAIFTKFLFFH